METEWPEWVTEAASGVGDPLLLDELKERLEAAGFSPADLRKEQDRVGVFLSEPLAPHQDAVDALFSLARAEQHRHEEAAEQLREVVRRQRSMDKRDQRQHERNERLEEKLPPPG